jgi:predicted amidohydrolase
MEKNFEKNKLYIEACAGRGAHLVCLPENFHYMGRTYLDGIEIA